MIHVADVARSLRFYIETLGLKLVFEGGPSWAIVDAGDGFGIALHGPSPGHAPGAPPPSGMAIGLGVRSVDDAVAILENRGVKFDIVKNERVHIAKFADVDGNPFYLFAEKAQ